MGSGRRCEAEDNGEVTGSWGNNTIDTIPYDKLVMRSHVV
jgi:hypothetical protein